MKVRFTERFRRSFQASPVPVQRAFGKQLDHLLRDLRHPSIRAKKYDRPRGIWQGRIDRDWRFYFRIEDDAYLLLDIMPHPK